MLRRPCSEAGRGCTPGDVVHAVAEWFSRDGRVTPGRAPGSQPVGMPNGHDPGFDPLAAYVKQQAKCPDCQVARQLFNGRIVEHDVFIRDTTATVKCPGSGKKIKGRR